MDRGWERVVRGGFGSLPLFKMVKKTLTSLGEDVFNDTEHCFSHHFPRQS
jgi:hypothetical protein